MPASVVTPSLFVAGTDGRFFRQRGVPAYGLVPCIFTAEDLKGYHGIDERLSLENLTLGTKIILDLTARLAHHLTHVVDALDRLSGRSGRTARPSA